MGNKTYEIRCNNIRFKNGKKCNRFLAKVTDFDILIPCPNCGEKHLIERLPFGQIKQRIQSTPIVKEKE